MGTLNVRVSDEGQHHQNQMLGESREMFRGAGSRGVVPVDTDKLAASLKDLTGEIGRLFSDIKAVGDFNLSQVEISLEISAEGGFNLIGSAKAGGKGAIKLSFEPK
jgi:L-serine deaminase